MGPTRPENPDHPEPRHPHPTSEAGHNLANLKTRDPPPDSKGRLEEITQFTLHRRRSLGKQLEIHESSSTKNTPITSLTNPFIRRPLKRYRETIGAVPLRNNLMTNVAGVVFDDHDHLLQLVIRDTGHCVAFRFGHVL